ncbi:ExbD/TolR family protein [Bartonella sp. B35(2025)]
MKLNFTDDYGDIFESGLHDEINVTPFIDVVLVLLIVFMVAAPLATSVIPVQLPSITQTSSAVQSNDPLYVTLQKDSSLYVGDNLVSQTGFVEALFKETKRNLDTKILIKADSAINYGIVIDLLNQIQTAGYTKVGLIGLQKSSNISVKDTASDTIGSAVVEAVDDAAMHTMTRMTNGMVDSLKVETVAPLQ